MAEPNNTLDRLKTLPMFESGTPATAADVRNIEVRLGVDLPPGYVSFLLKYGYAGWFGNEILGMRPADPVTGLPSTVTSDCIAKTLEQRSPQRRNGTAHLPPQHVVISTDGGGSSFVLFGLNSPHGGEVHCYNAEDAEGPIRTWKSFEDYLDEQINEASTSRHDSGA